MTNGEQVFDWKRRVTAEAAISALADEIKPHSDPVLTKRDREALARVMITHPVGAVTGGYGIVRWKRNGRGDVIWEVIRL